RRLFETAQDGILILNAETGQIDDVNPHMIEMLHYSHEEFLGKKLWEVSPFKDTVLNQAAFEELHDKGYIRYKDLPLETKEGKTIAAEFVSNVFDANGHKMIQCNIRNITEGKDAKQKLQEAVMFQQRLIDALPVPVFYKDSEGRYLGCNSSFEKYSGQKREQITGKSVFDLSPKEFADIYHEMDLALLQNPGIQIYEAEEKDGDGVVHNVILHKATFPNMDGSVGGLIGGILDITDLKRAEDNYRNIFENAQEGIFRSTPDGRITMSNQAMAKMFGFESPEEMLTGVTDIAHELYVNPDDRKKIVEIIEECGFIKRYEIQCYKKDRSIIWISLTMRAARDERGRIIYYDGISEDNTSRHQAVERMKKALGATIQAIAVIVETRDPYTAGHQKRVADLAHTIATKMNLPLDMIEGIRMAAAIHDLGKISVPSEILSKPTELSDVEFMLIKTHPQSGYDILKDLDFPWPVARTVLEHHERMNGSGYPNGLTGENILMESRILAVADVVESMASHRPYRPALGIDAAIDEIEKNKGTLYDDTVVDVCLRLFKEKHFSFDV
ncbi:MAG: PAS domain S-box protein, partial [Syntrophales bacterium]|nr:PAS domain S-box protein [Syntrophales bacterium]